jgi:2-C-methyl-D-erythritol 2,4-cyclodiphosphate synthase
MSISIGIGQDTHAFAPEGSTRPLVLGGVTIPGERGLAGHSDADVVAHAIADALLGAARLGDIGQHFPDDNPAYAGADSLKLLAQVTSLLTGRGFRILDVDCVVQAERPRLAEYRQQMRERLSQAMSLELSAVGVKATTCEGLGAIGRAEGIAATAVALLERDTDSA